MFRIAFPTLIAKPDILVDLMKPKSRHKILAAIWNRDLVLCITVELLLVRATVSGANLTVQLQTSKRKGNLQLQAISSVRLSNKLQIVKHFLPGEINQPHGTAIFSPTLVTIFFLAFTFQPNHLVVQICSASSAHDGRADFTWLFVLITKPWRCCCWYCWLL